MKKLRIRRWLLTHLWIAVLIAALFLYQDYQVPRFRDLTVELGTASLTANDFKAESAAARPGIFVSDVAGINLGQVGETELTLRQGIRKETVTLSVTDTTPPEADVETARLIPITGFPEAADLVSNIRDASDVTVFYREEPRVPLDYGDLPVTVVIEDTFGNRTEKICVFSFRWMKESVTLELGDEIAEELFLYNPLRDASFLDPEVLRQIRSGGAGEYVVTTTISGKTQKCTLCVQDTIGPELTLKDVQIRYGKKISLKNFLVRAEDPSGIAEVRLVSELGRKPKGKHPIIVEAEDKAGNITRKEATLYVASEFTAPKISGSMTALVLDKGAQLPDLMEGITAKDNKDGILPVVCDISAVNVHAGGTYYAVYRATDSSGNVATRKRRIDIIHDEEDTLRLAREIAATFADDDVAGMRNYVYYGIGYNYDWGGDDPVWFGFTEKRGNCYVHALCMKSLLDAKGIENQLIWTTDKTHYWLCVKIDNKWKHIEPTPSVFRLKMFMNDAERLATLSGRHWDTTQWPACS